MTPPEKKHYTKEDINSMLEHMDWIHSEMMKKTPEEREAIHKQWIKDSKRK
jgi:hypothetical protein